MLCYVSIYGVHIGATWRIRLNCPCAAAMRPYVKLLWPLVSLCLPFLFPFLFSFFFLPLLISYLPEYGPALFPGRRSYKVTEPGFSLFVAALCDRAGHIYFHPVVSIFYLSFFLASSQRPQIGCLPYFHTWCGHSANLECRSEMCCTRLAGNTGHKKSPFRHHTTLSGYIFGTKACIDNWKKTC